jgi:hypothetical protein
MDNQMSPDEQVTEKIIAAFKKEKLLSDEALAKLKPKLSTGALSGADWKIFFDVDRPKKESSK